MAGNGWFHLLFLGGALLVCLPRTAPAFRRQHLDTLSAAVPADSNNANKLFRAAAAMGNDPWPSLDGVSEADLAEVLRLACVFSESLDATSEERGEEECSLQRFILHNIQRFANVLSRSQSGARRCVVPMLVQTTQRGIAHRTRRAALKSLQSLRSTLPEVKEFLDLWEGVKGRSARRLEEAVNGQLKSDPEAQALAGRFLDSPWTVRKGKYDDAAMYHFGLTVRREPMTDLECAQACVYATDLATSASQKLFTKDMRDEWVGCAAYALLDGKKCVLFGFTPTREVTTSIGWGRIRNFTFPAAVQFCMKSMDDDGNETTVVSSCQRALTEQYSSAGAQTVTKLQNPTVVKHVCREECEMLVRTMNSGLEGTDEASLNYCSADVVQLVQAHNLHCCADACGWDSVSKTCAGVHLLSKVDQEEWFAECCSPSTVMLGSDRDYMCQSSSKSIWQTDVNPRKELQRSSFEAFQWGEDANPNFAETPTPQRTQPTTPQYSNGVTMPGDRPATKTTTTTSLTKTLETPQRAQAPTCGNVLVGSSTANSKVIPLPRAWLTCGARPVNKQVSTLTATFAVSVSGSKLTVRRSDAPNKGWQFPLELSCCSTPQALVEVRGFRSWQPSKSTLVQSQPCALSCADPTFMKSALLQCSASTSKEWVALAQGVQPCLQAIKSKKTQSPADCSRWGVSTTGATHASWQYLPGDKSNDRPHQGLCSLFSRCAMQDKNMFTSPKRSMSNDTEVLWSRLRS